MPGASGCENGCQHNDIRQLDHMRTIAGEKLKRLSKEEFVPFVWDFSKNILKAPQDNHGNTECYWRGVYFIQETNWTNAISPSVQGFDESTLRNDYAAGKFLCPKE